MSFLIWFAILVIVVVVLWWLLQQLPLPGPANQIIQIAIVVVVAVIVIGFLMGVPAGGGLHFPSWK